STGASYSGGAPSETSPRVHSTTSPFIADSFPRAFTHIRPCPPRSSQRKIIPSDGRTGTSLGPSDRAATRWSTQRATGGSTYELPAELLPATEQRPWSRRYDGLTLVLRLHGNTSPYDPRADSAAARSRTSCAAPCA